MVGGRWEDDDLSPEPPPRWFVVACLIVGAAFLAWAGAGFVSELVGSW